MKGLRFAEKLHSVVHCVAGTHDDCIHAASAGSVPAELALGSYSTTEDHTCSGFTYLHTVAASGPTVLLALGGVVPHGQGSVCEAHCLRPCRGELRIDL